MANHERGVYEPSDEVRVFDGSEEEEDVEGSRLPLMIVLALLVLAMFGGLVWLAYNQGVARGRGETPVLTAANGPEKIAPSQPGGANVPYQGFKIYEQPAPPDDSGDSAPSANTAPPPAPKPAPVTAAPVETPKPAPQQTVIAAPPAAKPVATASKPEAKPVPPPPALKPTTAAATPAPAKPAPKTMDALIRQAENLPPKPAPATTAPAGGAATAAPRQLGNPVPAAPAPKPVTATPAAATGSAVLQIGAYKSQAEADAAWKAYKAKHPAVAGYSEDVRQADLGAKGTWYRLRIAGFADKDAATSTCAKLKAEGGDCMLAK